MRPALAVLIALAPMLVAALVAWLTGHATLRDAIEAVGCTALLLGFAYLSARPCA